MPGVRIENDPLYDHLNPGHPNEQDFTPTTKTIELTNEEAMMK